MQLSFVFIMQASTSPLAAEVTPAWLAQVAAAVEVQLNRDVAPHWGGSYAVRVGTGADLQPGEVAFAIVDSLPNAPGAIAYHDVGGGDVPVAFLALSTCSTLGDVSVAISHECCETAGDWSCNFWADDGTGTEWALELCDAVESNAYVVQGVPVSDFLLPAFFAPAAPGPYSYTGAARAPFQTAPGGYQITRTATGTETQVQGDASGPRGLRALAGAHHATSRPARRGIPLAA
jgi:hypothetical protein